MRSHQRLVVFTGAIALSLFLFISYLKLDHAAGPVRFVGLSHPTWGDKTAPIQMVLFEDLKCKGCKQFNEEFLPKIFEKYVSTKLASLTFVPIAFLERGDALGNAFLSVHSKFGDLALSYLQKIESHSGDGVADWDSDEQLLNYAKELPGVDVDYLKACIESEKFLPELEKNYQIAEQVMGRRVSTPALYINGFRVTTSDWFELEDHIEKILHEEVNVSP
ncbi:MAG TPA: thioredoxin domain-containing protein [Chlamydiales bacterium]|nr:thioredoxin domain-containing protein [Chlamydiales bacterium]